MVFTEKLPRGFFKKGHLLPRRARACLPRGAQAPHDAPLLLPRCAELKRRPPPRRSVPSLGRRALSSLPLQTLARNPNRVRPPLAAVVLHAELPRVGQNAGLAVLYLVVQAIDAGAPHSPAPWSFSSASGRSSPRKLTGVQDLPEPNRLQPRDEGERALLPGPFSLSLSR